MTTNIQWYYYLHKEEYIYIDSFDLKIIYKFLSKFELHMYKIQSGFQTENFGELDFENIVECIVLHDSLDK